MANATIAITGAGGFLGKALTALLKKNNFEVVSISRSSGVDITKAETLTTIPDFDCLIHLAAHTFVPDSYNNTAAFFSINLNGTLNALELCKKRNARFIFSGSYVYGQPNYLPVDENHPINMWNPYASSKIICEQLCHVYNKEFQVPVDILRIFNIYGPGQNSSFLIPKIIEGVFKGQLNLETLTPRRDFIYVNDVCNAFLQCLLIHSEEQTFNVYNIGSGSSYSVQQIVDKVISFTGLNPTISCNEKRRAVEVEDVKADNSKIKRDKKWHPSVSFDQGLKDMIEIYRNENAL